MLREVCRLKEENLALQEQLDQFTTRESELARCRGIDEAILAAALPKELVNKKFRELCYQTRDGEELSRILEARKEDVAILESSVSRPRSVEQNRDLVIAAAVTDGASFASAIR